jgi:glycosyltransferase involved in cell wall biosynthesis
VRTVLFYREFTRFFGANLKVWDYFNHVLRVPGHTAYAHFTRESVWDATNPWTQCLERVVQDDTKVDADMLFLSGVDWLQLEPSRRDNPTLPVINYVQSLWHACPDDHLGRYDFLPHKAIRICVSPQVTEAVAETGRARGPIFTIPAAIDFEGLTKGNGRSQRDIDLLIVANKKTEPGKPPELGQPLLSRLQKPGRRIHLIDRHIPRSEYLDWFSRSRVTVLVLSKKEGCPLPPLEAMALGTVLVCPDCVGNRSYCIPEYNCFRPAYDEDAIVEAAESALEDPDALGDMVKNASRTAREHDLSVERRAFREILNRTSELWQAI